ncbi:MAG: hypothetical protein KAV87_52730 [Desulfobacteraceae bacterium]|nr:hypothetical protein [Desulfobacteraceae bacterium]
MDKKEIEAEFEKLAMQMIRHVDKYYHPHVTVIVDSRHAEIVEGIKCVNVTTNKRPKSIA